MLTESNPLSVASRIAFQVSLVCRRALYAVQNLGMSSLLKDVKFAADVIQ